MEKHSYFYVTTYRDRQGNDTEGNNAGDYRELWQAILVYEELEELDMMPVLTDSFSRVWLRHDPLMWRAHGGYTPHGAAVVAGILDVADATDIMKKEGKK